MIALYRGVSWASRLIEWRTRSEYSHAAWVCEDDGALCESWEKTGVRILPSVHCGHTPGTVVDLFSIDATHDQRLAIRQWFVRHKGERYDWLAIMGFAFYADMQARGKWFCSEALVTACRASGVNLVSPRTPAWRIPPGVLGYLPPSVMRPAGFVRA